ncbi:MAG: AlpA family phage regulatory protein [Magnetococcales bacterium]|nr:AlpA family phage regulatory protein [Magnetococcales bacterium]
MATAATQNLEATPHQPKSTSGIWRYPQVHQETGLSRTTIWRKVREGSFPAPIKLTGYNIGWIASEVLDWRNTRPRVIPV